MSKIKICGLTRKEDIDYVNFALPDFIGFVFAKSKRQVTLERAVRLKRDLNPAIKAVGVFVDAPVDEIKSAVDKKAVELVQLHGNEDEEYIRRLKSVCEINVIKAVKVRFREDILFWDSSPADYLLLDGARAGSGAPFDWSQICGTKKPLFLAGGIDCKNIQKALALSPFCVDLSSGAETAGVKDKLKIAQLVSAAHSYKGKD